MAEDAVASEFERLRTLDAGEVRARIRTGDYGGHTAGLGLGKLQCNLAILTKDLAGPFERFCLANPRPCPLVGMSEPGEPGIPYLGESIDLRCDLSGYNIYRDGRLAGQTDNIKDIWQDDFVAFAIGCSFTFEHALLRAGIALRHIERDLTVPMYRTSLETVAAGPFRGGMVVSMRPIRHVDVPRVTEMCAGFPHAHGAPLHTGDPAAIGIADIARPDWGDRVDIEDGETPVFWACGVTPQAALENARPPICITHRPGHMLITDVDEMSPPEESPFQKALREKTP